MAGMNFFTDNQGQLAFVPSDQFTWESVLADSLAINQQHAHVQQTAVPQADIDRVDWEEFLTEFPITAEQAAAINAAAAQLAATAASPATTITEASPPAPKSEKTKSRRPGQP